MAEVICSGSCSTAQSPLVSFMSQSVVSFAASVQAWKYWNREVFASVSEYVGETQQYYWLA